MPIIIFFSLIITAVHYASLNTSLPLALTTQNINSYITTYLYGDYVHSSYEHLIYDLVAFILIYYLAPKTNLFKFNKFAFKYIGVFIIANTVLNVFIMSKWFPGGNLTKYTGISAANFTLYFLIALCWLNRKVSFAITLIVLGALFIGLSPFMHNLAHQFGISLDVGNISVWAHISGAVLALPTWICIKKFF